LFENRVLRRMFGRRWGQKAEGWRKLHNEELHKLYASPKYYQSVQIKETEMGGPRSTHGRDEKMHITFWLENLNGRKHLEDLNVDGKIILEWILGKQGVRCGLDSCASG
jgi:hypothetical protein